MVESIEYSKNALKICNREDYPDSWASFASNLAVAFTMRVNGDRKNNIEKAIGYFKKVIVVHTKDTNPEMWAKVQSNLAGTYVKKVL